MSARSDLFQALRRDLASSQKDLAELENWRADQLTWNPEREWSAIQCLRHVALANEGYLQQLQALPEPNGEPLEWKPSLFYNWIRPLVSPDGPKGMLPPAFDPKGFAELHVLETIGTQLQLLKVLIDRYESRSLDGVIVSPLLKLMKFNIGDAISLVTLHTHRHTRQAEDRRNFPGFPR